jgi:glycosyltransferase involved in cell wall biosynthesis
MMVTGAYFPETSGGGLQARAVLRALRDDAEFVVLTTSADRALPPETVEDGVTIRRVHVDVGSGASQLTALARLTAAFAALAPRVDIVNLHGFSRKAILFVALSRIFRKRFVLTMQTSVQDEPAAVRRDGALAFWAYRSADLYLSVSPGLSRGYLEGGMPASRLRDVRNAVETDRFRPADDAERAALRAELGLARDRPLVLFVGYFSRDKRPDVMYRAWLASVHAGTDAGLIMIGATRAVHGEVDAAMGPAIREWAARDGVLDRVVFVEATTTIERYVRAANLFVLPSVREGLPIALIEAMSCGLPCVASRLPGATDALIEDGVSGLLVAPDDEAAMTQAIVAVLADPALAARLGAGARAAVLERYAIDRAARSWLAAYQELSPS